jgi:HEPN domain-containing protein
VEFLKQYKVLLKKAKADLSASKVILKAFEEGNIELELETIFFHLQQCGEKLLKSLLAYNNLHFTKTHSIKVLIEAIRENKIEIVDNIDVLVDLTHYAVDGRYAIIHDDLSDVDKYIILLEKFLIFVESVLND